MFENLLRRIAKRRRFLEDAGSLSLATILTMALGIVQGLVVARWLGPGGYGNVALILSYPALAFGLLSARTTTVWIRHLESSSREQSGSRTLGLIRLAVAVDLAIAMGTIIIVFATAGLAARFILDSRDFSSLLILYSLSFIPLALCNSAQAVCTIQRRFGRIARANVYGSVARFIIVILLLGLGLDISGVIVGYLIGHLVTASHMTRQAWQIASREWGSPWSGEALFPDRQALRRIGRFLFLANLSELSGVLVKQLDVVALGYFVPSREVGYYRLSRSVAGFMTLLIPSIRSVVYQRMVALQDRWSELLELTKRVAFWLAVPMAIVTLSATLWLPPLIPLFVGDSFVPVTPILRLWLLGYSFWLAFFWLRPFLFAGRAEKRWLLATVGGTASFLVAALPLSSSFGVVGMTAARISFPIVTHFLGCLMVFSMIWARRPKSSR